MKEHEYKTLENTKLWKIVEASINDLLNNQDLEEKTAHTYIVGYIVKCIAESESEGKAIIT
ncbi:MAG TPA: hypothetical protein VGU44_03885 [Gammaproteobacteria bacterium]|nr:hypothetical protein [Gammaproteobacteria bacterium]